MQAVSLTGKVAQRYVDFEICTSGEEEFLRRIASGVVDVTESHDLIKKRRGRNEAVKLKLRRKVSLLYIWTHHNRFLPSMQIVRHWNFHWRVDVLSVATDGF